MSCRFGCSVKQLPEGFTIYFWPFLDKITWAYCSVLYVYYCRCMCNLTWLTFHQVALAVEGSTMSGSLQRRKKSKRKWKRLWFLLKDKVLYTFTAREVRGHRVSHTSPETSTHSHDHSKAFPRSLYLSFCFFMSGQGSKELFNTHISTAEPFLLGTTLYVTNEGILCALSVSFVHIWYSLCSSQNTKFLLYSWQQDCFFNLCTHVWCHHSGFLRIKWLRRVYLCRASPSSWLRGRRERKAACSISTTRKPCTTPSGPMINRWHAGQHWSCLYKMDAAVFYPCSGADASLKSVFPDRESNPGRGGESAES